MLPLHRRSLLSALTLLAVAGAAAHGQSTTPDFSAVTALAQGAVTGQNVETPVPGFELLLMRDGVVLYHQAFGVWTIGTPANADSATKTLAGALVMTLVDRGQWSLQSRLSQFLPEFNTGLKANITIQQSFSHSAGMLSNSGAEGDPNITLRQAATQIASLPLRYIPGNTFSYGGVSMQAAGAAAEVAAGASWDSLFQQRIAGPLGMTATQFVLTSPQNPRIAGGCESTGRDFAIFMETLRRGGLAPDGHTRILTQAAVNAMLTRQTAEDINIANTPSILGLADYGVGIWLDQRDADGHLLGCLAAGARGFSSWIDLDDRMVGVFATDLSASGNVQPLLYLLRDAAQAAVRQADCPPDFNLDAHLDPDDLADFITCYFNSASVETTCPAADYNQDGNINPDDLGDYITAYFIGCA